jgi:hypothetical protein
VSKALPAMSARDPALAPLCRWIAAASEADAAERLDVYANMYFFRLLDVLRGDYPNLAKLVGDDAFHNLVTGYVLAHPSEDPSLRWIGRHLPDYLEASRALAERFPAAAALARLEWVRSDVFDAEDAPVATEADLARATPETFASMRLRMQPALRVIELDHRVLPLWLALERGESERPDAPAGSNRAIVWRRKFRVFHRSASVWEPECLAAAVTGATFAQLCETLWPHAGDDTPKVATEFLRNWLSQEMIASIIFTGDESASST